ncbi:transporter substrate-binding domain-containing protein (plasmid) [Pseudoalteromonas xiamenensis]|uniref:substrate-binding periplasmic protein n=1 Tax=Pseudoalteromonas xiamenensis TaxID=882626 RepID=UPI0027E4103E|nr:transporter substrate-binding domain-containing protein [Pseudoalteromonas xiamenensis]WMN61687.1 transporter substrate-binding domain-containing protein [Pseudoalteromonas xiamenensis]
MKWTAIACCMLLLPFLTSAKDEDLYVGGHSIWPPYFISTQTGLSVEIVKAAFNASNKGFEFHPSPFSRAMRELAKGDLDLITALWKTPAREAVYEFSEPYISNQLYFVTSPTVPIDYQGLVSLSGHHICTILGFGYQSLLDPIKDLKQMTLLELRTCLLQLHKERVEGVIADKHAALYEFKQDPAFSSFSFREPIIADWPVHIAVLKSNPRASQIIESFNQGLRLIQQNGTYDQIVNRYMDSR